ncbi:MAG: arginine deiminase [Clostridia bacterium]|nr:arginine deiminase [Clostridia bacterium]MDO5302805.1 arginine deiminase [Clostridia bacterium]
MKDGIHNFSEIGKLNKVLLHRPGRELEKLTPDNFEELLFDDIPFLKVAQEEHDKFAKLLQDNGVEVVYYEKEVAKALADKNVREQFVDEFIKLSPIDADGRKDELKEFLNEKSADDLVETCISGLFTADLSTIKGDSLIDVVELNGEKKAFASLPMVNLYFSRDPGICVGNGVNINHMSTPTRRREALLMKYMTKYDRDFAPEGTPIWYDAYDNFSMEGGDVLILSDEIVAVGHSQRTTLEGIESFASKLLKNSSFKKVLVFDIPKSRAFMQLDTVFNMIDFDKFVLHPEIEGPLAVYEITLGADGEPDYNSITDSLDKILAKELNLPTVDITRIGGGNLIAAQREQWNDASNILTIAPGTVVAFERNYVTNDILDKKGVKVLTIESAEISRGRGGPRSLTCPINRDDL